MSGNVLFVVANDCPVFIFGLGAATALLKVRCLWQTFLLSPSVYGFRVSGEDIGSSKDR